MHKVSDLQRAINEAETKKYLADLEDDVSGDSDGFNEEEMEAGDEFMATKPWLGAMKEPTGFKESFN